MKRAAEKVKRLRYKPEEKQARKDFNKIATDFRRQQRTARQAFIKQTVEELQTAMKKKDWGRFYEDMRSFGVHLGGTRRIGQEAHSAEQVAD